MIKGQQVKIISGFDLHDYPRGTVGRFERKLNSDPEVVEVWVEYNGEEILEQFYYDEVKELI